MVIDRFFLKIKKNETFIVSHKTKINSMKMCHL